MSDVFISYAREDRESITPLVLALERRGWSVFWDRTIQTGETWRQVIGRELDDAKCIIVIWSTASVESHWVNDEADEGVRRGLLIPVRVEDVVPPIGFRSFQTADLSAWNGDFTAFALQALLNDVASMLNNTRGRQGSASWAPRARTAPSDRPFADPQNFTMPQGGAPTPLSYVPQPRDLYQSDTDRDDADSGGGFWWLCGRGVAAILRLLFFLLARAFELVMFLLLQLAKLCLFVGAALFRAGRRLFVLTTAVYLGMTLLFAASGDADPGATMLFAFNALVLLVVGTMAGFGKTPFSNACAAAGIVQLVILAVSLIAPGRSWASAALLSLGFVGLFFALSFRYRIVERRQAARTGP